MATAMAAAYFLVLLLAAPTVYGVDHTVGGKDGWALSVDYSTWAAGETFRVGDNLVFNYQTSHKVDTVSENDYNSCSSSKAIKSYEGGSTKIALTSPGKMYFICPVPGHCAGGMKLAINVVAAGNTPSTSPTTPATPSPPSGSGTPATTTSSSPPPPPKNAAVSGFGTINQLRGSLFVASIIFAFMS